MAFAFKPNQSVAKGVARIASKEMEDSLEMLGDQRPVSRDEAVHEVRKSFKKIRAVLRLVRPIIGERCFQEENSVFRDAARPLTEVRDAQILIETIDNLRNHFHDRVRERSFHSIRQELVANHREIRKRVLDEPDTFTTVAGVVRQALDRIDSWSDVNDRWKSVGEGLEEVYQQARQAFHQADTDPTVENLHEWRKQAKYLRYQLELLEPTWPEQMKALAEQTDHLGELLGDDHDLAVLRQTLTGDPDRFGDEATREVLLALIDRRRAELEQEAKHLGQLLFQDRPSDFTGRLKGYWKTWRSTPEPQEETAPALL
jgi:CHAD domain-containing protein